MPEDEEALRDVDWTLTTWEGARREQLCRWAALPLERIVMALEEMGDLGERLARESRSEAPDRGS